MNVVIDHCPVLWGVCVCGWLPDFAAAALLKDQLVDHLLDNGWVIGDDNISDR